jgi:WD40 repeat protein/serine/threonine protein kinase
MNAVAQHAKEVFLELVGHVPPEQWDERLAQLCAGDADLARRVTALLKAHRQPDQRLDQPAVEIDWDLTANVPLTERTGMMIGPYKLLEELGEGGFGVVFMAEQTAPMRRRVALKLLKPGMDTRQVVARFEAERQALALMDHPHIARVLDGGETTSGRPFFVMELVRGIPITEFCDRNHLSVRERLQLFTTVCHAVQHAHQKGVIHRDMKPSNVLVTLHDGVPVAKVIDFGIAKAAGQQLTEKTLFTNYAQMIGTPLYMSPEQAELSGLDVDTRSDIYSLGVLLYELLTGTTPFDKERLKAAGYDEMRRLIREEDPARPSDRISTLGEAAATISANRGSDPRRLLQLCRGELDWIVMKALEKDRNRRYETAAALAADVEHFLHDEPVVACPPSSWYRLRKFASRNKGVLFTGGAIAAGLLVAVGSLISTVRVLAASNAQIKAEQAQTKTALDNEKRTSNALAKSLDREEQTSYFQRIAMAEREIAAANVGRAEELLDDCPVHLRGWEWHYLRRRPCGPRTYRGHEQGVHGFALSPDGQHVASTGTAADGVHGEIRIWERATGRDVRVLAGRPGAPIALAYSPDGKHLAGGGWDRSVAVWDLETNEERVLPREHSDYVADIEYSPDGKVFASASWDGTIVIWDARTLQKVRTLRGHTKGVNDVDFTSDGRLASAGHDSTARLWDVRTGQTLREFRSHSGHVISVALSSDGKRLATAGLDGTAKVWNVADAQLQFTLRTETLLLMSLALSPDGKRLAAAGFERSIRLWDLETQHEAITLRGHTEMVLGLAFTPDGSQLVSSARDGTVKIWDSGPRSTSEGPEAQTLRGHQGAVLSVAFHPDGRRLATASLDESARIWNLSTRESALLLPSHEGPVGGVSLSCDGRWLATSSFDGMVKLWDVAANRQVREFRGFAASVALSPDGSRVASASESGDLLLWDAADGEEASPSFRAHASSIVSLVFAPNGNSLATTSMDRTVRLWDVASGRELRQFVGHRSVVQTIAFSADGQHMATASWDKTAKIWDVATGQELLTLRGHGDRVIGVAFSPDARQVATASWDNTVKIWDAATGGEITTLEGHTGYVFSVAFSPDGKRLASGSGYRGQGEVKIWETADWQATREPSPAAREADRPK